MAQIQPPETFDFSTPNEWPKWRKRFERYLVVSGMKKKEEADKIDLFMYLMGDCADDIFGTFKFEKEEEATKIDSVLKAFDSHFCVRKNIIYERAKFNSRIQEDRELVDEFITSLYKLADSCEFEGLHEQLIRDRIVVGVRDKALSERMQFGQRTDFGKGGENGSTAGSRSTAASRPAASLNKPKGQSGEVQLEETITETTTAAFEEEGEVSQNKITMSKMRRILRTSDCGYVYITTLRNGSYEIKEKIYVIRRLSEPLLSRRACELLNLARRIEVVATRINPIKEFPEVFEGLGQIGNPYEIKLKPVAKPYAVHTPRRVPIPLMEKLKTRLEELDKDEILTKILEAQQEDTTLKAVVNYLEQGWADKKKMSQALLSYWHVKDEFGVQNGLLMRSCRLVIPASMKLEILDKLHAGHFGITKTRLRARETVWWPGISEEIAETVRKCSVCIQEAVSKHEPLIPTNFPTRPWQNIGMDLFKFENKWYLVVIDYYSRFPEMIQLDRLTASVVVRSCKSIFARNGIPETVVSDNGTQFGAAREFANFARQYGFTHVTSSPRFPQSNGMAEAGVKIAKLILKKNQDPSLGLLEYRSTPLENGYSPAELLMGRKLRTTLPIAPENLNPKSPWLEMQKHSIICNVNKYPFILLCDLGCLIEQNCTPVFCKARPVPFALRTMVEQELERLVKLGFIYPVTSSSWATPVVVVPKKNKGIRIFCDFKVTLNKFSDSTIYPLQTQEDIFTVIREVDPGEAKPKEADHVTLSRFNSRQNKALAKICLAIGDEQQLHVRNINSTEVWAELEKVYAPKDSKKNSDFATTTKTTHRNIHSIQVWTPIWQESILLTSKNENKILEDRAMIILCGMSEENVVSTLCNLPEEEFTCATVEQKVLEKAERDQDFEIFVKCLRFAFAANDTSLAKQVPVLLAVIGSKLFKLAEDLVAPEKLETKSFDEIIALLNRHLTPTPRVIPARYNFFKSSQEDKTISQFMATLRGLAEPCKFGSMLNEMLRDKLVVGVRSENLQKRLLQEGNDATLDKIYEIALSYEAAERDLLHRYNYFEFCRPVLSMKKVAYADANVHDVKKLNSACSHCGRHNHLSNKCFFKNAKCHECGKIGHIKPACKNRKTKYAKIQHGSKATGKINVVEAGENGKYFITLNVDNKNIQFEFDTGSCHTLMPINLYKKLWNKKIFPINLHLKSYSNTKIDVIGKREVFVAEANKSLPLIITEANRPVLLGTTWIKCLLAKFLKFSDINLVQETTCSSLVNKFAEGFGISNVGVIKDHKAHLILRKDANPIFFRARNVPYVMRNAIAKELENLEAQGVITKIERSDWATPIVKKNQADAGDRVTGRKTKFGSREIAVRMQQEISQCIHDRRWSMALQLALPLHLGETSHSILMEMMNSADKIKETVAETLKDLTPEELVPIMEKNGHVRICGDFKITLNPVLKIDQYPLPKIEDIFAILGRGINFSKKDLSQAYLQLELDENSKEMAVINTHKGLYRYNRLPFGIASAQAIWQRIIEQILSGIPGTLVYLDDILITGESEADHLRNLEAVLNRLNKYGLKANREKCNFFQESLEYCGHVIDKMGLHKTNDKIRAVLDAPKPLNVTQLRAFLGLITYYHKFIRNAADVLLPLYAVLKKGTKWHWSTECRKAFRQIKEIISSDQILIAYDPKLPIRLSCDSSSYGLGAVLSQIDVDGNERPIYFISRTLSQAEKKYSQIDKECLSIIWALKKFNNYLFGRKFELITDNKPLHHILNPKREISLNMSTRLQRWALILSSHNFTIECRKTGDHGNADGLSRLPLEQYEEMEEDAVNTVHMIIQCEELPLTSSHIRRESCKDSILKIVYQNTLYGWKDKPSNTELLSFYLRREELTVEQGILLLGTRVVIPRKFRAKIKTELHQGHLVEGIDVKPEEESQKVAWNKRNDKAMVIISTAIVFKQLEHLITCDTAQKQWTRLKSIYEQRSTTSLLVIQQQFYSYKINEKDAMSKHISKIEGLIKQLCELGEKVSEAAFMAKVLGSLPSKYAHFLTAWDSVTQTEQTKENLNARLLQEEIRLDQKDQQDDATAFKATANYNWKKNKTCNYCKRPDVWYLDSGASEHMTNRIDWFSEFNELDEEYQVKLGDNHVINASGKGTILISCYVDGEWTKGILKNVLYVPEIRKNLFSAGEATNLGNKIITEKETCNIFMNDKKVACGTKGSNNLYTMLFKVTHEAEANTANAYSLTWWHRRLGHINVDTIRMMAKNGQFSDLKLREEKDLFCEAYDQSAYRVVYFIRHKSDVFTKFKEFDALIKNQFGRSVKIFRTDNGTEYVNQSFLDYLRKNGIIHERSAPYTPQQNGFVERDLRTILGLSRSMLHDSGLEKNLWAEAVNTAVYALNRTLSNNEKTPLELWSGRKSTFKHFKIFGSEAYANIPKQFRSKWDSKTKKMIFVGYEHTSKNYRLYDPKSGQIVVCRNVTVREPNPVDTCDTQMKIAPISIESEGSSQHQDEDSTQEGTCGPTHSYNLRPRKTSQCDVASAWIAESLEPVTYEEAMSSKDKINWEIAMNEEKQALIKNKTWELMDLPDNAKAIGCKWIFRIKRKGNGEIDRYRARLVAKGFSQRRGIDYKETFAPVVRYDSESWTPVDPNMKLTRENINDTHDMHNVPYAEAIGCLMFLAVCSRPDIAFAVNKLSRFMAAPVLTHWNALKRIFKYLKGTLDSGILYKRKDVIKLIGYSDADFAGDIDTRRSTSGYIFLLAGGPVTWTSQRQSVVALSTTEAEYIAASMASREAVWLKLLIKELTPNDNPVPLMIDNQSAIRLILNPEFHKRTKHVDVKFQFIREQHKMKIIKIFNCPTEEQLADLLTKALPATRFKRLFKDIGMSALLSSGSAEEFDYMVNKFDGTNYQIWKYQIEIILRQQGLLDLVEGIDVKPEEESQKVAWNKRNDKAMVIISTAIVFKQLEHLITCDTAQKQWTRLKSIYEQRSTKSLLVIQQQFYSYKMNEKDAMSKHISKIEGLIKQLCELGEKLSEDAFMAKVLGSLPSKYAHFLTAWDSVTQTEQTKENLNARLLQEEIRLDQKDQQDDATAFKATANYNWKKNKTCNYCKRPDVWYLDSGASEHMTNRIDWFSEFNELDEEYQVKLGDNHVINASGKGTILISCYVDGEWTKGILKNVLYVPEIRKNLFSAGEATNLGNKIITEKETCNIFMNDKKVACGTKGSNNLYTMLFKVTHEAEANTANAYSLTWWHRRLGHINVDTIRMMAKNGQFSDLKLREEKDLFCEAYDQSAYRVVYFIRHKSDVFTKFKEFDALIKNQFGRSVKIFRTDNGTEYVNQSFLDYLRKNGIIHERSAPYTPQQNGFVERDLRTILGLSRSMLHDSGLEKNLWAEAVNTAVYALNRTLSNNEKTPLELWSGRKSTFKHFKIFGSEAYANIPKQFRSKWDSKTKKMIFVGYEHTSKNYRLYDPKSGQIVVCRNVTVREPNPVDTCDTQMKIAPISIESERSSQHQDEDSTQEGTCGPTHSYNLRPRKTSQCDVASAWIAESLEPELMDLPDNAKAIGCKWIFRIKRKGNGEIDRYRARLVAKGFSQRRGIDYKETFAPVVRYDSVRVLLALATVMDMEIMQFDIKTAFLNGDLDEDIFMQIPEGIEVENKNLVCKLKKSLYGLKQSPRIWNEKFTYFLKQFQLTQSQADPCVFYQTKTDAKIFIALYVDDGIMMSTSNNLLKELAQYLSSHFEVTISTQNQFVGLEIDKDKEKGLIFLSQTSYIKRILDKFNMTSCNSSGTPVDPNMKLTRENINDTHDMHNVPYAEAIGCLMFLAVCSRPDIAFAVNKLSRFMAAPVLTHWNALKRIFKYLKGTLDSGILYKRKDVIKLIGYSNADFAGDIDTRRSTSGYIFLLAGGPVTWTSQRQSVVALSTTEAEYIAASMASREAVWLKLLIKELTPNDNPVPLMIDNQSAIRLILNPEFHKRTKHVYVKFHFIREQHKMKIIKIFNCPTEEQLADLLTKALWRKTKFGSREIAVMMQQEISQWIHDRRWSMALQLALPLDLGETSHSILMEMMNSADKIKETVAETLKDLTPKELGTLMEHSFYWMANFPHQRHPAIFILCHLSQTYSYQELLHIYPEFEDKRPFFLAQLEDFQSEINEDLGASQTFLEMTKELTPNLNPVPLIIDNQSAIRLILNPEFHKRTKHVYVKFHFIREQHKMKIIKIFNCPTEEQLADLLTKALRRKTKFGSREIAVRMQQEISQCIHDRRWSMALQLALPLDLGETSHSILMEMMDSADKIKETVAETLKDLTPKELDYLRKNGIIHERSAPYTPQQNGFVERDLRTILGLSRSMLHDSGLEKYLWAEAVNTAVYALNRTLSNNEKTPLELWSGRKSTFKHFKIFGSEAYANIPKQFRSKWDSKTKKMIFVGYEHTSKNYRLYDPKSGQIVVCRNVTVREPNPVDTCDTQMKIAPISIESERSSQHQDEDSTQKGTCGPTHSYNLRPRKTSQCDVASAWIAESLEPELMDLPDNAKAIGCKWIFRIKRKGNGEIDRYRARLVAKGFSQRRGIDYKETFAPVVRYDSVRVLLALATVMDMEIMQFDIKTAFLNGDLDEDIYMQIPEGIEVENKNLVCKIKKSLYGLKQSPRIWNEKFTYFLKQFQLTQSQADPCVFYQTKTDAKIFIALYVDDGIMMSTSNNLLKELAQYLSSHFEVTISTQNQFVGLEIDKEKGLIFLSQTSYIKRILDKFNMTSCNSSGTPVDPNMKLTRENINDTHDMHNVPYAEAIGCLMFLAVCSRPDIAFAVNKLSRFMAAPVLTHWNALKRIFKYLKGTLDSGILYKRKDVIKLIGYSDADFADDIDTRRSTSGYIFLLAGGPVTWTSQRQSVVALSTTEAEYIAASMASREAVWLKLLIKELTPNDNPVPLMIDNQSAIRLILNPEFHKRTKHVYVKFHFIREQHKMKIIKIFNCPTEEQLADLLTKALWRKTKFGSREIAVRMQQEISQCIHDRRWSMALQPALPLDLGETSHSILMEMMNSADKIKETVAETLKDLTPEELGTLMEHSFYWMANFPHQRHPAIFILCHLSQTYSYQELLHIYPEFEDKRPFFLAQLEDFQSEINEDLGASQTFLEMTLKKKKKELTPNDNPVPLMIDNQSAIRLILNPEFHKRTKNVDVKFHFIREQHKMKIIKIFNCPTEEQLADLLTKALRRKTKFGSREIAVRMQQEISQCIHDRLKKKKKKELTPNDNPVPLMIDNQNAIRLILNPEFHKHTKHVDVKFHFIREQHKMKIIKIFTCSTEEQLADLLTKALRRKTKFGSREIALKKKKKELTPNDNPVPLMIDNQSAIRLILNPEFHKRTKHVDVKFHFIREQHKMKIIKIFNCPTEKQLADLLTKALRRKTKFGSREIANGFVERDLRTILGLSRSMLHDSVLEKNLWAEAVNTAVYALNRTLSNNDKTPLELWSGRKSTFKHFKIFGSEAYANIPKQFRSKWDSKTKKMIFVGYEHTSKNYRLDDPKSGQIVVCRNVTVREPNPVDTCDTQMKIAPISIESEGSSQHQDEDSTQEGTCGPTHSYNLRPRKTSQCDVASAWIAESLEPVTYEEAMSSKDKINWEIAMNEEKQALIKNKTWELMDLPDNAKAIGCKWIFRIKRKGNGEIDRYRARLVAKGFSQRRGIDYKETFAPVVRYDSESYDGIMMSTSNNLLKELAQYLSSHFEVTISTQNQFVGLEIDKDKEKGLIFLSQTSYIKRILDKFNMTSCNSSGTPVDPNMKLTRENINDTHDMHNVPYAEAIGCLMFLAVCSRPDIAFAVNKLSRFMAAPVLTHWNALKRIFKYLKGTLDSGILYKRKDVIKLIGYSDADFAGDIDTRRSTSGYIFLLAGGPVTWTSQRQSVVALSTTEAKYIAASMASREAVWLKLLIKELTPNDNPVPLMIDNQSAIRLILNPEFHKRTKHKELTPNDNPVPLMIDNQSAIRLILNPEFHKRTKHVYVKFHFIREQHKMKIIKIFNCPTEEQLADLLTKALRRKTKFGHKSDVFTKFKEFDALIKNQFARSVKIFRTDNGTEYVNQSFLDYLRKNGIIHERSAPYTPQQNGFVERDLRTILGLSRSMLHDSGLEKNLWAEAVNTAVYALNRTLSNNEKTPLELWSSRKSTFKHFKIFGSEAYANIPKQFRSKWDSKTKKMIFVGYEHTSKNYRLDDPKSGQIVVCRNVTVREPNPVDTCDTQMKIAPISIESEGSSQHQDEDSTQEGTCGPTHSYNLRPRKTSQCDVASAWIAESLEPVTYEEAMSSKDKINWEIAMNEEKQALIKNKTWELMDLPDNAKAIGFVRYDSVRVLLALATVMDMEIMQFDIKTAFLNGDLDEDIYMQIPEGIEVENKNLVCKLKKSLYGLKQSPRIWNEKFTYFLKQFQLTQSQADPCVFYQTKTDAKIFIALYVDDGIMMSTSNNLLKELAQYLSSHFEVTISTQNQFVGLEIDKDKEKGLIFLSQTSYIKRILDKFNMTSCNSSGTPVDPKMKLTRENINDTHDMHNVPYAEAIGCLMFLAVCSRPDIAFAVNKLSRFMAAPVLTHWNALKRIFKYLKGTLESGILYKRKDVIKLIGYSDADFAGDIDTRRSTSGYIFLLAGGPVTWTSQRQSVVALSTTEAEYIAASMASREAVWLKLLIKELTPNDNPVPLMIDNQSAIRLILNPEFHKRTKHVYVKFHFIREQHKMKIIKIFNCPTEEQLADLLTKVLRRKTKFGSREIAVRMQQEILQCIHDRRWSMALQLALPLDLGETSHSILMEMMNSADKIKETVAEILKDLTPKEL
ncbi:hypothetical protein LAZ67_17000981, partial [Cordylochernes scorpioides]